MEFWFLQLIPGIVVGLFFLVGILTAFLPVIPATVIIWIGILIHKLWAGDHSVSWNFFLLATALTLLAQVLDWACTYWGARKFGGSWRAGLGALVGIIAGPFILTPLPGLVFGPVIGAVAGELIGGKQLRHASKAGFGTIVGGLIAFILKFAIACFMIAGFYFNIFKY